MAMPHFLVRVGDTVRRAAANAGSIAPALDKVSSKILLSAVLAAAWGLSCAVASPDLPPKELLPATDIRVGQNGFVVMELFSSEGCSSCPSADEKFNRLAAEAREKKVPVHCLAYHVDYWNALSTPHGVWKDPYSSAENTRRQSQYAQAVAEWKNQPALAKRMFTPQFALDAFRSQSERGESSAQTMVRLLAMDRPVSVKLSADQKPSGYLYSARDVPEGCHLLVALVERGLVQQVERGENAGMTLKHDQVVRAFKTHPLVAGSPSGELQFPLPEGVKAENCSLIAYVQDAKTMEIHGATVLELAASKAGETKKEPPAPTSAP